MKTELENYIEEAGLVATDDPKIDRPVYRRPGFNELLTPDELDQRIVAALQEARVSRNLTRAELAILFGSAPAAYGRYENGITKLTATRIIQLCEVLRIVPDDLFFNAAPHLWGDDPEEVQKRRRITKLAQQLPPDSLETVTTLLEAMLALRNTSPQSK
ncbi:helix-turn-helix domain-containing protein [Rhizobium tumorigenes]|uniref:Helix-turn-helix transcriptional regulator n=1 Tax=Rhizobium tumorigenes TaxID=2041385 RepID=A0AAF1KW45_9HYPH|nr:helix-turn-helix transcriptional regulator [Rhizobium tumorigenes]WFR97811.1 helix-turn-helix transcriptional regulator [Rhizobium tumorigenes]WFS03372.1 helix-turn-helix transcriptional regulator [Rhizobium tumorigenes]